MSSMRGHHSHWEATPLREEAGMLSIMSSMRGQLSHWEAASQREAGRLFKMNIMRGQLFHMALSHVCLSLCCHQLSYG